MTDLLREIEDAVVVDFESDPIAPRPNYPPVPCGVALKYGDAPARYYAWGHHGHANSDSLDDGVNALFTAWQSGRPLLFHHQKFDAAVAEERLGLPRLPWDRGHDTLPMLFLIDPRADTYSLKPSAEALLGWKPEERDAVVDWLVQHQPVPGIKLSAAPKGKHYAGAYVAWAPPALVAEYCCGDVDRTRALALHAAKRLVELDMVGAYDRERRLLPVLADMERRGVRVAVDRLAGDLDDAEFTAIMIDAWLRDRLGLGDSANLDSGDELAAALVACGAATRAGLGVTPKSGKLQTNKDAFARGIVDPQLKAVLRYRAALATAVTTFMAPWLATAQAAGGRIFTTWNSTRTARDAGFRDAGARTGRFSSNPNFQNIPKEVAPVFACAAAPTLPADPLGLPPLPRVRSYVLPEVGHVLIGRDFASQELRVMAHYEDDVVAQAYRDAPDLDLHQYVTDTLNRRGHAMKRRRAKNLHFAVLYGVGVGHLAELLGCSVEEARAILNAYYREFPSVERLIKEVRARWRAGAAIRTWGGRVYPPEPPQLVDGRMRGWEYKAINVLVQGSSADLTKAAMIDYYEADGGEAPLLLTVHDELVATAPLDIHMAAMDRLRTAMNADRLDVPMRSDGYVGPDWERKTKLEELPAPPPPEPSAPEPAPDAPPRTRYKKPNGELDHEPPQPD